jgi:hypothetical protein
VVSGHRRVHAGSVHVVGGVCLSGGSVSPKAVTGATPLADPLAALPVPPPGAPPVAVNLGGSSTMTIDPGVYPAITVSGKARLTMTPGNYEIAGGGFNLSGRVQVTGHRSADRQCQQPVSLRGRRDVRRHERGRLSRGGTPTTGSR